MTEVQTKIKSVRRLMEENQLTGVRFKGVDWFSWITGGGRSSVIFTSEQGVAEVFITRHEAWVLTNRIEHDRLVQEEIPKDFEVLSFPWEDETAASKFVASKATRDTCASDRPSGPERTFNNDFQILKMTLLPEEITKYRQVGKLAAEAMTEALGQADPGWSENRLAGEGARALWSRGLDPALVMVGGERRVQIHRHPIATTAPLGAYAMMVFCARGFGLYANLTRFVFFREPTKGEISQFQKVANVETTAFKMSVPGTQLSDIYKSMASTYADCGSPDEIHKHHQGGLTGYLSREYIASPNSPASLKLRPNMALAWNPSFPGAKIEDTVIITENGLEILTVDPKWPTFNISGRARPDVWIQK